MLKTLRAVVVDKRQRWHTIGGRLETFSLVVVALVAFAAGRATVLL